MHRLLNKLKTEKMCLIASLPENTYEMAKAAWESGADAIKVHMNVFHRASQNTFGSFESLKPFFEKVLKDCPVPVGLVPGEETFLCEKVMDEVVKMGFDFISLYGHHTPASLLARKDISKFYSISSAYSWDEIDFICDSPLIDMMELSICLPETYGERLNARDLLRYEHIAKRTKVPTIVPTQHVVYPEDIEILHKTGIKALMLGAVTYGKTVEGVAKSVAAFRKAIDELK